MLQALVYLVVVLLVASLFLWLIDYIPVQAPLNRWAKIIIIVIAAFAIIGVLLNIAGVPTGLSIR